MMLAPTALFAQATIPYTCDFETSSERSNWTIANGSYTNKWVIGKQTYSSSNHSLYITTAGTPDENSDYQYNNGSASYVYAYRQINITTAGEHTVSFKWKAKGESGCWDAMYAALVPPGTACPPASNITGSTNSLPTNYINVADVSQSKSTTGVFLWTNDDSGWKSSSMDVNLSATGVYTLVFYWKNDGGGGNNPPAAVDDISITRLTCPKPTAISVTAITSNSATVSWTPGGSETSWVVKYSTNSDFSDAITINVNTNPTANITGLLDGKTYYVQVKANCGGGNESSWRTTSFKTEWGVPGCEEFTNSSIPTGWSNYYGVFPAAPTSGTNGPYWIFTNTNVFGQYHAKLNIYGTACKAWLATPDISLTSNTELSFDLALTAYNSTNSASGTRADDRFIVLIYANSAWSILREWNNNGSSDVYNSISNTGQSESIDLSAYTGQTVRIAFYGESTVGSNGDNDLHIDNVCFNSTSSCPTTISNLQDWNDFCDCVNNGHDYYGETVTLTADLTGANTVTTMAGDAGHPFRGTFEGNEHYIDVNYVANYPDNNDHFTAPFICTDGVTIQNLRINGTINMGGFNYGAGLIGACYGNTTITNCVSNVTINSSRNGDGTMGGFIVRNYGQYTAGNAEYTTTFNGCAFTGSLLGASTYNCAGFVAWDEYVSWAEGNHYAKVVFNDCLFAPTSVTMGTSGSATFSRYRDDSKVTMNNSYYFQSFGTEQGKQAYSVTGIDGVTVDRNSPTATYSVSGITAYTTGIKYNSTFYGGNEDVLALLLSHSPGFCGYFADYGSLSDGTVTGTNDPYNLTMVAHNTQIGVVPCASCSHTENTVGSESGYITCYSPVAAHNNYSYSQIIYTPDEVCVSSAGADLYGIAFNYYGLTSSGLGGNIVRNVTIYLSETTNSSLSNSWETTGLTQVYSGNVAFVKGGWAWITFDSPFSYSGSKNLVVTINDQSGYNFGDFCQFLQDNSPTDGTYRSHSDYNNTTPFTTPSPGDPFLYHARPWTKFCVDCTFPAPVCFDFNSDSYSTDPTTDNGLPSGWDRIYSGTNTGAAPHVIRLSAFDCGSNGILMAASQAVTFGNTSIVVLPRVTGITEGSQITFTYKCQNSAGILRLGYMNGATFTQLAEFPNTTSCTDANYTLTAAQATELENNNRRLAFEWYYNTNTTTQFVLIDDICIEPSCDTVNVGDLNSTNTNSDLPSNSYYNYSLSQQIYEPCEIGKAGSLTSIALYNGGSTKNRTYDIYLKTTANNTFASTTDWIAATVADRVFSGSVTMTANTWTVIEFDAPFAYDGTSNLAVIIDDNSASYKNGMACRVYNANGNQAIYVRSDGTNYNPSSPGSYTGTLLTVKNQVKFNVCNAVDIPKYTVTATPSPAAGGTTTVVNDYGCHYTVTATPNECYKFVNWTEGSSEVSTDATYSFTATSNRTLVANFELRTVSISCGAENLIVGRTSTYSVSGDGLTDGQVSWSYSGTGSVTFSPNTGLSTTVTATGAGSGTITATISSCGGSTHTCTLNMIEVCDDPDTANVGDHTGTDTHAFLPSHSNYRYALTQQIYKPCEIGKKGTITSIAFYNGGSSQTRTYDIYLKTTTKNVFANTTDWISVTTADRVYSGSVTMAYNSWTVIEFDVPYEYDGNSNLAVIIDDNKGSYSSGMLCRVYNADGNQTIYICSDGTNYNPLTDPITYTGTLANRKNQIKFSVCDAVDIPASNYTVTVSASPAAGGTVTSEDNKCDNFTVTATPNDCYRFVNWTENGVEASTAATYSFHADGNRNLVANFEAYNVSITSDPNPLTCLASGTEVTLTAITDIPMNSLAEYTFTSGTDASRWYNVTNTTNLITSAGDHVNSTVNNIGFSFPLGGTNYTQFSVNSDGNLRLGSEIDGSNSYYTTPFSSNNANYKNPKINGFGFDGYFDITNYGNYVHMQVFGTAPNRVLVVEFNESPYNSTYRPYPWKWQVQLFENGIVQIVYYSTAPTSYGVANQVGLCVNASDGWTVSTTTHEATHFTNGTSTTNTGANSWPGVNRWYRFTPPCPYTWTYTGTAGTADCDTYTASPTQNSSYTVSVSGVGCTGKSATVNVSLQFNATIEFGD